MKLRIVLWVVLAVSVLLTVHAITMQINTGHGKLVLGPALYLCITGAAGFIAFKMLYPNK